MKNLNKTTKNLRKETKKMKKSNHKKRKAKNKLTAIALLIHYISIKFQNYTTVKLKKHIK